MIVSLAKNNIYVNSSAKIYCILLLIVIEYRM
jgi:hypothetical protein